MLASFFWGGKLLLLLRHIRRSAAKGVAASKMAPHNLKLANFVAAAVDHMHCQRGRQRDKQREERAALGKKKNLNVAFQPLKKKRKERNCRRYRQPCETS